MIKRLEIRNFRSIPEADIEIAPINVLTGANNSGKSSVMYALLTLKNIAAIPNQPVDSFFTYGFLNLGGFKEAVHMKKENAQIQIGIDCSSGDAVCGYSISLGKKGSSFNIDIQQPHKVRVEHPVTFPYPANTFSGAEIEDEFTLAKISWNGLTPTITVQTKKAEEVADLTVANRIEASFNMPIEDLRRVEFVPLKRGFTLPVFSAVPIQPQLLTEQEVATAIANDRDLEARIDHYLERIVNKNFIARPLLGTASFVLNARDRGTGLVCDLVNEGFGTNQLVYLLTKVLSKDDQSICCIEEPEVHLHPDAIVRLIDTVCEIAKDQKKCFIISTHSEHIIFALLNRVASEKMLPSDINLYHLTKSRSATLIERQTITEKGQLEGGLKGFYETELKLSKEFFHVPEGS